MNKLFYKVVVVASSVVLTLLLAKTAQGASVSFINFESDTPGTIPNGFSSVDEPGIAFNFLSAEIGNFGIASDGQALKSLSPFTSSLGNAGVVIITAPEPRFPGFITRVSFDFGNDDPSLTNPGDLAVLKIFLAGEQVGLVTKELNRDTAINQRIEFAGLNFARLEFAYTDASFNPLLVQEVIDNISFEFGSKTLPPTPVPEPLTIAGTAVAGIMGLWIKRKQNQKAM